MVRVKSRSRTAALKPAGAGVIRRSKGKSSQMRGGRSGPAGSSKPGGRKSLYQKGCAQLEVSTIPDRLPCRDNEMKDILDFVSGALERAVLWGQGSALYVSGVPGTGKTAVIQECVRVLEENEACKEGDFKVEWLNAMVLPAPSHVYQAIYSKLFPDRERVSNAEAPQALEAYFTSDACTPTLLVIDEIDMLLTRNQSVLYNLLDWPTRDGSRLVLISIANTVNLLEEIMPRVGSRAGANRLTFLPYSQKQLSEILEDRLQDVKLPKGSAAGGTDPKNADIFEPKALELAARSVAAVTGDARRVLQLARVSLELAEEDARRQGKLRETQPIPARAYIQVSMAHIASARARLFRNTSVRALKALSSQQLLFLAAVMMEAQGSSPASTSGIVVFENVLAQLADLCALHGFAAPSFPTCCDHLLSLERIGLLAADRSTRSYRFARLHLNIGREDLIYGAKTTPVGRKVFAKVE